MSDPKKTQGLVWLDLETTGLDPNEDSILEVALSIPWSPFNEGSPYSEPTIESKVIAFRGAIESDFVFNMHSKSGLLVECRSSNPLVAESARAADKFFCGMLAGFGRGELTLAGSSAHFDLAFLRSSMPGLAEKFHHRILDVSAIKMFAYSMGMPELPKAEAHRAAADIRESWSHLCEVRAWFEAQQQNRHFEGYTSGFAQGCADERALIVNRLRERRQNINGHEMYELLSDLADEVEARGA